MEKKYRNEDWLREQYEVLERKVSEIAEECGVQPSTLYNWIDKYELEKRQNHTSGKYRDEDWLRGKYWDEKMSVDEIGDEIGCSGETIRRWLDRHGIDARDSSEAVALQWEGNEERRQRAAENMMKNAHPEAPQIKHGEHRPETIEKMAEAKVGEKNPVWVGGYEGEYGHTWPRMREKALERDEYECQVCGAEEQLHVHHKLPVRTFEDPNEAHYMVNLVTCCVTCHPKLERISRRHTFVRDVQI